jgi:hypothetical protein
VEYDANHWLVKEELLPDRPKESDFKGKSFGRNYSERSLKR